MTIEMTHEQASEEIEAVALGIATEEASEGVTAHARGCPECAAELGSFYLVVGALSQMVPERQLNRGHSAGVKSRLLARATAERRGAPLRRETRPPSPTQAEPSVARVLRTPSRRSGTPVWIAGAAVLITAVAIAKLLTATGERDSLRAPTVDAGAADARIGELERAAAEKDATIASLAGPGVRIISLLNREAREPLARMFWDRRSNRWTLFVYNLRQPRAGKTFQIWLGTDGGRVPLGTFRPATDGTASFSAHHPLAAAALNTVSITEEDAGGANAPTGPVLLAGALR